MDTTRQSVAAHRVGVGIVSALLMMVPIGPLAAQSGGHAGRTDARSGKAFAPGDSTLNRTAGTATLGAASSWAQFEKYFADTSTSSASLATDKKPVADTTAHRTSATVEAAPSAALPTARPAAPTAETAAKSAPAPAPPVDVGFGTIKLTGGIQFWYTSSAGASDNTFRLRRAELRLLGQINPSVSWVLDVDAAKALTANNQYSVVDGNRVLVDASTNQASRILQDAFVTVVLHRTLRVDVGQFKIPFTNEGLNSPWTIETVEQPMYISDRARGGGWAMARDAGIMLRGVPDTHVDYFIGAFNGSGDLQNSTDRDTQKALIGRLVVRALVPGLQFGVSGVYGGTPTPDRARRDRYGADAQFTTSAITLRSEFVSGADANVRRAGYYLHAGVRLNSDYEALVRYDVWDPDVSTDATAGAATAREALLGVTRFLGGKTTKAQLNVARRSYAGNLILTVTQLQLSMQAAW